jgi:hypothetical protein
MTLGVAPGIRRWEPSAAFISIASGHPAIAFFCFYFDIIYFWYLVLFKSASSSSSLLFPSIIRDYVECRQFFTCPTIVRVPTAMSRGPSPG